MVTLFYIPSSKTSYELPENPETMLLIDATQIRAFSEYDNIYKRIDQIPLNHRWRVAVVGEMDDDISKTLKDRGVLRVRHAHYIGTLETRALEEAFEDRRPS